MESQEAGNKPKEETPKEKVVEAIRDNNLEKLDSLLKDINLRLTGYEQSHFSEGAEEERIGMLKDFLEETKEGGLAEVIIYLGDGGFSRLSLYSDGGVIGVELTDNSTKKVKDTWEKINTTS